MTRTVDLLPTAMTMNQRRRVGRTVADEWEAGRI